MKFTRLSSTKAPNYWSQTINQPLFHTWSGLAYERVCLQHIEQIKQAIGIAGIISNVYSWQHTPKNKDEKGTQIGHQNKEKSIFANDYLVWRKKKLMGKRHPYPTDHG